MAPEGVPFFEVALSSFPSNWSGGGTKAALWEDGGSGDAGSGPLCVCVCVRIHEHVCMRVWRGLSLSGARVCLHQQGAEVRRISCLRAGHRFIGF